MNITIRPARVNISMNSNGVSASTGTPVVKEFIDRDPYTGEYEVTPSEETQVLETKNLRMTDDVTVDSIPSDYVGSEVPRKTSSDMTNNGATVTAPAGYYESEATKSVPNATWHGSTQINRTPSISVDNNGLVTATIPTNSSNTTPIATDGYALANHLYPVSASGSNTLQLSTEAGKTVTPTESEQTAVAEHKYTTGNVKVGAISSTYVGSGIGRNDSDDLTASGKTVTAPAGYYESNATKSVSDASWLAGKTIETDPSISVDENGLITANYLYSTTMKPISTSGWADKNHTVSVTVKGTGTHQLTTKSSSDLTASGKTVTAPAGFYAEAATKDVADATWKSASTISVIPDISVDSSGLITANCSGWTSVSPLSASGYADSGTSAPIQIAGAKTSQLATIGATTYTPTKGTVQTIQHGNFLTGDQTISAIPDSWYDMGGALAWLGVDAQLVTTLTLADVKLSATDFNGWTPSTTAKDILATRTAGTFVATDAPNWNYYIVWETIIPEVVYTGSPVDKARPLYLVSVHVNEIYRRPSSYANIQSVTLNNSVNMSAFTASNFLRYYGSTQGSVTYTWGASYGFYAGITAATLSSASVDSPTITAKSPKVTARCSTTYFSTGNAALVDQDKTIIKQKAYIYKAKIPTLMQGLWNRVVSLVNEVDP